MSEFKPGDVVSAITDIFDGITKTTIDEGAQMKVVDVPSATSEWVIVKHKKKLVIVKPSEIALWDI